jgi:hypothetical protein
MDFTIWKGRSPKVKENNKTKKKLASPGLEELHHDTIADDSWNLILFKKL